MLFAGGALALAVGGVSVWRAQAAVRSRARTLSQMATEEGERLAEAAERLNRHGFEFQHTLDALAPRLAVLSGFMRQPLVAAATPWLIRRMLGRPLKKRRP
ncbi:MAG TPA: hypothetical protein VET65_12185 [Candidatus Limnocylindrales bacterium]|nr:hypothetical protein [Candidatus Limnocylindrales bacterium]